MRRLLAVLSIVTLPAAALGQGTISAADAEAHMKSRYGNSCLPLPVGVHKTPPLALLDDNQRGLVRRVVALEKAGVVTVNSVGSLTENIMTVELRPDVDKAHLSPFVQTPCIKLFASYNVTRVVKIDKAEGGTAIKWNASLAYVVVEFERNPYYERYEQNLGNTLKQGRQSMKGVVLFRQDPFSQKWAIRTIDVADLDAPVFEMKSVAQGLRSD